jgi:hypothetical protein
MTRENVSTSRTTSTTMVSLRLNFYNKIFLGITYYTFDVVVVLSHQSIGGNVLFNTAMSKTPTSAPAKCATWFTPVEPTPPTFAIILASL